MVCSLNLISIKKLIVNKSLLYLLVFKNYIYMFLYIYTHIHAHIYVLYMYTHIHAHICVERERERLYGVETITPYVVPQFGEEKKNQWDQIR